MTTRRELLRLAAQTATATVLAAHGGAAAAQSQAHRTTERRGLPLLDLQQRFVDP